MNERRERTTTTDMRDGDYDDTRTDDTADRAAANRGTSAPSTADMAAAMSQRTGTDTTETTPPAGSNSRSTPLFAGNDSETFRSRWTDIQTGFVDEPRHAVEEADGLVAEVIQRLAQTFADERTKLEQQWGKGDDVSTEDLRLSLQRYRSFFERLLAA